MVREQDPPLNLAMLAAWVRQKGVEVAILDCALDAPDLMSFGKQLSVYKEKHQGRKFVIGFYICTPTAYQCYELAKISRNIFPDAVLVAGGPHATFVFNEVLNEAPIDIVLIGESELSLEEIVLQKPIESISGIAFKDKNNEIVKTLPRERITDINILPMPAYDLLKITKYRPPIGAFKRLPSFMLTFSRGCPNNCSFCTKTLGKNHLQKSPEKILEEVKFLYKNYGVVDFVFVDDTFTTNRGNVIRFCQLLKDENINISWHCYTRVDHVDAELLQIMKKAGCHQLMYGVESFSPEVLNLINKNITPQLIEKAVVITKNAGISCRLSLMVGNRGDTKESLELTLKEVLRLKPDFINVLIATPGPGTPFFEWADREGRILSKQWDLYTGSTPLVRLEGLSSKEINDFFKKFWLRFYFHPLIIFKLITKTTNKYQIYNLFKGFMRVMGFLVKRK